MLCVRKSLAYLHKVERYCGSPRSSAFIFYGTWRSLELSTSTIKKLERRDAWHEMRERP